MLSKRWKLRRRQAARMNKGRMDTRQRRHMAEQLEVRAAPGSMVVDMLSLIGHPLSTARQAHILSAAMKAEASDQDKTAGPGPQQEFDFEDKQAEPADIGKRYDIALEAGRRSAGTSRHARPIPKPSQGQSRTRTSSTARNRRSRITGSPSQHNWYPVGSMTGSLNGDGHTQIVSGAKRFTSDVSGDGTLSPFDALLVINYLNDSTRAEGAGEAAEGEISVAADQFDRTCVGAHRCRLPREG